MNQQHLNSLSPGSRPLQAARQSPQVSERKLSWSGTLAKAIARVLHDWLPTLFDNVDPWFSDTDIPAGTTWFTEIQERLNSSKYGIIVVTTENFEKPWLNFEAGSLSKKLGEDVTRVTPLLVGFDKLNQLTGHPLSQYNAVLLEKAGIWRLCESIALTAGKKTVNVQSRFEQMWPGLEEAMEKAKKAAGDQPRPPDVSESQELQVLTEDPEVVFVCHVQKTITEVVAYQEQRAANLLHGHDLGAAYAPLMATNQREPTRSKWARREPQTSITQGQNRTTASIRKRPHPLIENQRVRGSKP